MHYAVTAYDFTDEHALSRRMANREAHLERVREEIDRGRFLSGGAILDSEGRMIGSTLHVAFDSRAALDAWLADDPYVQGRVWERMEVLEVKLVPMT